VAQPIFGVLEDSPEFFVARDNGAGDIVALALALTLVAPALLFLLELALVRAEPVRRAVHLVAVGALVAALALQFIKGVGDPGTAAMFAGAALAGAGGAVIYARVAPIRAGLTILSPAPLVLALLFLFASPVSKLVLPQDVSSASTSVRGDVPVVFVMFDEFPSTMLMDRAGRIDRRRFPHFAALAADSTWYRNATTVADLTPQAVPAALTGRVPERGQLPVLADHPDNLFTLLDGDYRLHVEEPVTDLCPESACDESTSGRSFAQRLRDLADDLSVVYAHRLAPPDLEEELPAVDQAFGGFRRQAGGAPGSPQRLLAQLAFDDRRSLWERFIGGIRPSTSSPALDFVHIELPHVPAQYLPSGQEYAITARDPPYNRERWTTLQAYQRHVLQVGYTDHLLGQMVRRLKSAGIYDRALMVVTADHGASYRVGDERRRLTNTNFADIAAVPLLIKEPRQSRGRTDDAPARSIDILPTIADVLGVKLPWDAEGRSLREDPGPGRRLAVIPQRGDTIHFGLADFESRRDDELRRMSRLLGSGLEGLYAAGPAPDLVGRAVAGLDASSPTAVRARVDDEARFAAVEPRARVVPAWVTGRLENAGEDAHDIAVALDGRIAAVSRSYGRSAEPRFAAMIDPARFHRGRNRVELFEVRGLVGARRLAPLGRQTFALERRGSKTVISVSGRRYPVVPGAVDGRVQQVNTAFRVVVGWAGDVRRGRPADRIVMFQDGRFVGEGGATEPSPDVARAEGKGLARAGFAVTTDTPDIRLDPQRLRVFAISGGAASELGG
jgi:hypothetical protein